MTAGWSRRWRARWIRAAERAEFTLFRAVIEAPEARTVRCRVTADGRYVAWCNGIELGRGPVRSEPAHLTFDPYEIQLRAGRNVIAVLIRHYGRPTLYWKPATPAGGLGLGGLLFESDVLSSNAAWRAVAAPYEPVEDDADHGPPSAEVLRAREMTAWLDPAFDDSAWPAAVEIAPNEVGFPRVDPPLDPFGFLAERPIPPLASRELRPLASWRHGERTVFDFGTITNAHPVVESSGDVEVRAGEDLLDGDVVMDVRDWRMTVRGGGAMTSFEPIGFRYLSVLGACDDVRAVERTYPRAPGPVFSCDDEAVNAIWAAGVRTLDLCSTDAYIDCPSREQRAWLGDAYLHQLVSFACNHDVRLARWNLRLHAQGQRPDGLLPMTAANDFSMRAYTIPDFTLHWVRALARWHEHTGDPEPLVELAPVAIRALGFFEALRNRDGLVEDLPGWIFIDWAQTERGRHIGAIDALYALACDDAAAVATAIDDAGTASRLRARADRTREAFERYFDPDRGVYTDVLGGRRVSQQTNALAILCGAAPADRWRAMLDAIVDPERVRRTRTPADPGTLDERVRSQLMPLADFDEERHVVEAQPFFAHFLHAALARAGRHEAILASIRRWAPMVARNGCVEEYWEAPPGRGSRCHAWAATPTYDLTTHVLGVRPAEPGWRRIVVEPHLSGLREASGTVPTPAGAIRIAVRAEEITADLPAPGELRWGGGVRPLPPGRSTVVA